MLVLVTALCSEGPMFRRFYVQKVLCSEGPMFRKFYVQKVLYSEGSIFRRSYVQKYLFRRSYVQKVGVTTAHDVFATLKQRQWRWFNVAKTLCAQWDFPSLNEVWWNCRYESYNYILKEVGLRCSKYHIKTSDIDVEISIILSYVVYGIILCWMWSLSGMWW